MGPPDGAQGSSRQDPVGPSLHLYLLGSSAPHPVPSQVSEKVPPHAQQNPLGPPGPSSSGWQTRCFRKKSGMDLPPRCPPPLPTPPGQPHLRVRASSHQGCTCRGGPEQRHLGAEDMRINWGPSLQISHVAHLASSEPTERGKRGTSCALEIQCPGPLAKVLIGRHRTLLISCGREWGVSTGQ